MSFQCKGSINCPAKFIKVPTPRHVIINFQNPRDKEIILFVTRDGENCSYSKVQRLECFQFSQNSPVTRRQWGNAFQLLRENDSQARILFNYQRSVRVE